MFLIHIRIKTILLISTIYHHMLQPYCRLTSPGYSSIREICRDNVTNDFYIGNRDVDGHFIATKLTTEQTKSLLANRQLVHQGSLWTIA